MVLVVVACLAGLGLHRFWLRQIEHFTGDARWIWVTDALERAVPAAGLFVGRLTLAEPPGEALLKVCGDREYVIYVNGTPAGCGWSRPGFRLDLYDIAPLLRKGENTIIAELRSPTSTGGLLLALDVEGVGSNVLVSGSGLAFRKRFSLAAASVGDSEVPVVWGDPPRFPWGYPILVSRPRTLDACVVEDPVRIPLAGASELPGGGWLFTLVRPVVGYLWIEFADDRPAWTVSVPHHKGVDLAWARPIAQPVVRVPGQTRWLDPEPREFGQVLVFGRGRPVAVEIWPLDEAVSSSAPGVVRGISGPEPRTRWTTRTPPE